jgi:hypothetical protein
MRAETVNLGEPWGAMGERPSGRLRRPVLRGRETVRETV